MFHDIDGLRMSLNMNLLQLLEPSFLYLCELNRVYRKDGTREIATIRADIADLREGIQSALIQEDASLNEQFEAIELPFIYFKNHGKEDLHLDEEVSTNIQSMRLIVQEIF